jgi:hypothetical protein
MKKTLIAALLGTAAGFAAAQNGTVTTPIVAPPATPVNTPSPKVEADKTVEQGDRQTYRTQKSNTQAERTQLRSDRAAGNTAAVKTDDAALKGDEASKQADHSALKGAHATTHLQRGAHKHPGVQPVTK